MGRETLVRNGQWQAEQWLERRRETAEDEHVQQYVYVLEANRVFPNGVTLKHAILRHGHPFFSTVANLA
jgi:hypothetical protein